MIIYGKNDHPDVNGFKKNILKYINFVSSLVIILQKDLMNKDKLYVCFEYMGFLNSQYNNHKDKNIGNDNDKTKIIYEDERLFKIIKNYPYERILNSGNYSMDNNNIVINDIRKEIIEMNKQKVELGKWKPNNETSIKDEKTRKNNERTRFISINFRRKYNVCYKSKEKYKEKEKEKKEETFIKFSSSNNIRVDTFEDIIKIKPVTNMKDLLLSLSSQNEDRKKQAIKSLSSLLENPPLDISLFHSDLCLILLRLQSQLQEEESSNWLMTMSSLEKLFLLFPSETTQIFCMILFI